MVFGYVAEIKLSDGDGTNTPALIQAVTMIPWRFGLTAQEYGASHLFCRVQAFISRAIFPTAVAVVSVGDPIVGFIEPTNGGPKSAQLVSWSVCVARNIPSFPLMLFPRALETWRITAPATPPTYWELHQDPLYVVPQLHGLHFSYLRAPHLNVGVFEAPPLNFVLTVPSNPSPQLAAQLEAQFSAHRRMIGRFPVAPTTPLRCALAGLPRVTPPRAVPRVPLRLLTPLNGGAVAPR